MKKAVWRTRSQILVLILAGLSAYVAYGLYRGWVMWAWITGYWIVLTVKNWCDYKAGKKEANE